MEVREAAAGDTHPLRLAVLRPGLPPDSLVDPPDAVHLAAFDGETVVGAVVLLPRPFPSRPGPVAFQLRGMAVASERQGSGLGARLLDAVLMAAADRGADIVWCHARTSAREFYRRHGWHVEGAEFAGALDLPHVVMWRTVEPSRDPTSSEVEQADSGGAARA